MKADRKFSSYCGYCHGDKPDPGSAKWGVDAYKLSVYDYQEMMKRNWRRCGVYCYKYNLEKSCCQPYSIRLDVTEWQITKSQKKVLKKFHNYLIHGKNEGDEEEKEPGVPE